MTRLHDRRRCAGTTLLLCGLLGAAFACSGNSTPSTPPVTTPTTTSPVGAAGGAAPGVTPAATGAAGGGVSAPSQPDGTAGGGAPVQGPDQDPTKPGVTPTTPGMTTMPTTPTTPATPGVSEWTVMGYDPGNSYNNTAETKLTRENAATLEMKYQVDMGGNVYGAALQVGDKIFASASSVRAFEAATGKMLWMVTPGTQGSLAYADGVLYLNGSGGSVTALNAEDGKQLWKQDSDPKQSADGMSSPVVGGDFVLVGGSNGGNELAGGSFRGYVAAHDRKTGMLLWTTYTVPEGTKGASVWSSPSLDPTAGVGFIATGNNYGMPASDTSDAFIAVDLKTGAVKYKAQAVMGDTFGGGGLGNGPDADFGANPVLYETMVGATMTKLIAAGNKGGQAHAVQREDGKKVWERMLCPGTADGSKGVFTNSAWSGKNIILACNEGGPATLFGLDGATGDIAWMRKLDGLVWGRISIANGVGFVGTGSKLEAFNTDTGALIKSFSGKGGTIASTPTIANGRVAFGEGLTWSSGIAGRTLTVLSLP